MYLFSSRDCKTTRGQNLRSEKNLTRSVEHASWHGHGSGFKHRYTVLKSTILLHKLDKWQFHVIEAVSDGQEHGSIFEISFFDSK